MDFILNGQGSGSVATALIANNMDTGILRPFFGSDGNTYVTIHNGWGADGKPKYKTVLARNANATLTKDAWIQLDQAILGAARPRLKLVADVRSSGLVYNVPGGMGKTVLQHQRMTDGGTAGISMDALQKFDQDRPEADILSLPLPIISADFSFGARQLAVSKQGGMPLDTTEAEQAGRRCAEVAERLFLGTFGQTSFGGGSIYGLTNFPSRITRALTLPTANGWTGTTLLNELLLAKADAVAVNYPGPFAVYNSPAWDPYLDADYSSTKGENTLRDRINKTKGFAPMETLDYLTGYQIILVQKTQDVFRAVIGMDFTTIQWESMGGLMIHFKVMGIMVPQPRADINDATGIVHCTGA